MNGRRIRTWAEQDACTRFRRVLIWKPGERAWVKNQANRRDRREAKRQIREEAP